MSSNSSVQPEVAEKVEEKEEVVEVHGFEPGLNWQGFCRKYAELHSVKYSIAIIEAGKAWKEYKEKHGVVSKNKPIKKPEDFHIKRQEVPLGKSGKRYKTRISIKPPPQGYKVLVSYVPDDEASEPIMVSESKNKPKVEVAANVPKRAVKEKKPVKQVEEVVTSDDSEEFEDEVSEFTDEEEGSEAEE